MMITVTAIVYATLIGPYEVLSGFALVTNPLQHIVVPAAFVGTAALAGPRGGITWATLGRALLIPVAWVAYTLVRGSFTHQYPLRLRERVAHRLRAGRDQHRGDPGWRPALHGALRGRGLADP